MSPISTPIPGNQTARLRPATAYARPVAGAFSHCPRCIAIIALATLLLNVINQSFGLWLLKIKSIQPTLSDPAGQNSTSRN